MTRIKAEHGGTWRVIFPNGDDTPAGTLARACEIARAWGGTQAFALAFEPGDTTRYKVTFCGDLFTFWSWEQDWKGSTIDLACAMPQMQKHYTNDRADRGELVRLMVLDAMPGRRSNPHTVEMLTTLVDAWVE